MELGTRIGNFNIRSNLHEGTHVRRFLVQEGWGRRQAVLQLLRSEFASDQAVSDRFRLAAATASQLDHENIAPIYACGEHEACPYTATEFVEGQDLQVIMAEGGPVPYEIAVLSLLDVARGLEYAHERKVIHGLLRPAHLIFSRSGQIKITDFGLPWELGGIAPISGEDILREKIRYSSPEQVSGKPVTAATDLFSLGVIGYELLAVRPFGGPTGEAVIKAILERDPDPLEDLGPPVPGPLARLIHRLLSKEVEPRGTATLVRAELEEIVEALALEKGQDLMREFLQHPLQGRKRIMEYRARWKKAAIESRAGRRPSFGRDDSGLKARLGGILSKKITFQAERPVAQATGPIAFAPAVLSPPQSAASESPAVDPAPPEDVTPPAEVASPADAAPLEAAPVEPPAETPPSAPAAPATEATEDAPAARRPPFWKAWLARGRAIRLRRPHPAYGIGVLAVVLLGVLTVALTKTIGRHGPPVHPGAAVAGSISPAGTLSGATGAEAAGPDASTAPAGGSASYHVICRPMKVFVSVDGTRVEGEKTDSFDIELGPGNHQFRALHPGLRLDEVLQVQVPAEGTNRTLILDLKNRRVLSRP